MNETVSGGNTEERTSKMPGQISQEKYQETFFHIIHTVKLITKNHDINDPFRLYSWKIEVEILKKVSSPSRLCLVLTDTRIVLRRNITHLLLIKPS